MSRFSSLQLVGLITIPLVISVGQILFKKSSDAIKEGGSIIDLCLNPYLWIALFLYGSATILWIFTIKDIPISRAYFFMALSFFYVPLLSSLLLSETVQWPQWVGAILIMAGIAMSSFKLDDGT